MSKLSDLVAISRLEVEVFGDRVEQIYRERRLRWVVTWTRERKLGEGGFAEVHIQRREGNELRAVKQLRKHDSSIDWRRELEAAALFSQPKYEESFVKSLGWYDTADHVYLVMEYLRFGDLTRYMGKRFPEVEARSIIHQILVALDHMHERDFIHRDLKPANVLIRERGPDWWVKLADFGISKRVQRSESTLRTKVYTPQFVAPEVRIDDKPYTRAVDIWSTGMIAFLLLSAEHTFLESNEVWRYYMQADALPERRLPDQRLAALDVSGPGCEFVAQLLSPLPASRPSAAACLKHEWIPVEEEPSPAARQPLKDVDVSEGLSIEQSTPSESQDLTSRFARWTTVDDTQDPVDVRWTTIDDSTPDPGGEQATKESHLKPMSKADPPKSLVNAPDRPLTSASELKDSVPSPDADNKDATRPIDVRTPSYARRDTVPPLGQEQIQHFSARFDRAGPRNGMLDWFAVAPRMSEYGLQDHFMLSIWRRVDRGNKGALDRTEFIVAMHLAASLQSREMTKLPATLSHTWFTAIEDLGASTTARNGSATTDPSTVTEVPSCAEATSSLISRQKDSHTLPVSGANQLASVQQTQGTQVLEGRQWSGASQRLEGHTGPINSVAFSPDSRLLVSASNDETLRSWNVKTGAAVWTVKAPRKSWKHVFHCVAFSPHGDVVATGESEAKVGMYDANTGSAQHVFQGDGRLITDIAFSRNGNILASAGHKDAILIWDVRMRNLLKKLRGYERQSLGVSFAPNGLTIASAFKDMTVRIWDTRSWKQRQVLKHDQDIASVAFSPNGTQLVSASSDPGVGSKMWIWDARNWTEQRQVFVSTQSLAFTPDSSQLATAGYRRAVRIWDTNLWAEEEKVPNSNAGSWECNARAVAFSGDGTKLATGYQDGTVQIWNVT